MLFLNSLFRSILILLAVFGYANTAAIKRIRRDTLAIGPDFPEPWEGRIIYEKPSTPTKYCLTDPLTAIDTTKTDELAYFFPCDPQNINQLWTSHGSVRGIDTSSSDIPDINRLEYWTTALFRNKGTGQCIYGVHSYLEGIRRYPTAGYDIRGSILLSANCDRPGNLFTFGTSAGGARHIRHSNPATSCPAGTQETIAALPLDNRLATVAPEMVVPWYMTLWGCLAAPGKDGASVYLEPSPIQRAYDTHVQRVEHDKGKWNKPS